MTEHGSIRISGPHRLTVMHSIITVLSTTMASSWRYRAANQRLERTGGQPAGYYQESMSAGRSNAERLGRGRAHDSTPTSNLASAASEARILSNQKEITKCKSEQG